jgi:hypothetical protein
MASSVGIMTLPFRLRAKSSNKVPGNLARAAPESPAVRGDSAAGPIYL